jgi:hypothetical protein
MAESDRDKAAFAFFTCSTSRAGWQGTAGYDAELE